MWPDKRHEYAADKEAESNMPMRGKLDTPGLDSFEDSR